MAFGDEIVHKFLGGSIIERPEYQTVRENKMTGAQEPVTYPACVTVYAGRDEHRLDLCTVKALVELYTSNAGFRTFCQA